jgi:hypothetical protein
MWYVCYRFWTWSDNVVCFLLDFGPDLTMWYASYSILDLIWQCGMFLVRSDPKSNKKHTTLSDQVQNLKQTYHIVRSGPKPNNKHTQLSDQVQNLKQTYHIVRSGPKSNKKHTTLDLIWQCGMFLIRFWTWSDNVVCFLLDFGPDLTMWYVSY